MKNRKHIDIRPIKESEVKEAIGYCLDQDKRILPEFTHSFKKAYSVNQFYEATENIDWTTGFWTGQLWLDYENSGNEIFKKAAEIQIDSFLHRIEEKIDVDHHDMGFLYIPSCVAGYKLTGNKNGRKAAIRAADQWISRYHPEGEYIQAWGSMNTPQNCRLIIDCLLNVPLLYWATTETGDPKYKEIGLKHTKTTLNTVIREDFSTWHTYFFDPEDGKPSHGATCQGYRDGSAWARGQAWGVYGIALSYHYTKEEKYIELFKNSI